MHGIEADRIACDGVTRDVGIILDDAVEMVDHEIARERLHCALDVLRVSLDKLRHEIDELEQPVHRLLMRRNVLVNFVSNG